MRRSLLLACAATLAVPAGASAATRFGPIDDGPRPLAQPFKDVTPTHKVQARAASTPRAQAAAYSGYKISGGPTIQVALSPTEGSVPRSDVQKFVDAVFAWMSKPAAYGSEVRKIKVLIEPTSEVQRDCGSSDALACYSPYTSKIYVPDEDTPPDQLPLDFVVAHEYAHHIANNRTNPPFGAPPSYAAGDFGPKYWATKERVCPRYDAGILFPGDEGDHYEANPGESWAESFAMRLFPQYLPYWGYIPILKPNAAAFGAIRHDVQSPWTKSAKKTVGWRIGKGRTSYKLYKLTTPLDGEARISISGAPGARFRIRGVLSKKAAPSRLADYHKRSASLLVCGNRTAAFKVRRLAGTGKLHVKLSRP